MDPDDPLIRRRATLNPYLAGAGMILRRLRWDLDPRAWASRRRLRLLRDGHRGEKAVILCNGPSLLKSDLGLLEGIYTFGLNKINLLFDHSAFRPSCVVAINRLVLEQNADFFNTTQIPLFLASRAKGQVRLRDNVVFLHASAQRAFAKDCSMDVYEGYTVTAVALQLAFHMGFAQVALIGADHHFAAKGAANKIVTSTERDDSHFDPRYFAGGLKWELPDLFESEVSYTMAKDMFQAHDRRVVNATVGGQLEVFPRMALDEFVRGR